MKNSQKIKQILMVLITLIVAFLALLFDRYQLAKQDINLGVILFYIISSIILAIPVLITFSLLKSAKKQSHNKLTKKQQIESFTLFILPLFIVFVSSNLPRFIVKGDYIPGGDVVLDGLNDYITIRLIGYFLAFLSSIISVIYFVVNICKKTAGKVFWWFSGILSSIFTVMIGVSLINLITNQSFSSAKLFGYWVVAGPVYASFIVALIADKILTRKKK